MDKKEISTLLSKMTNDIDKNLKLIKQKFGNLEFRDDSNQSILHILVDNLYDEEKCLVAIRTLLQNNFDPNLVDDFDYIFIQTALYAGYSEKFILKIIMMSLTYSNLNINHIDSDKDTIMHTVIYSDDYTGEINNIYTLLINNGFDSTRVDHEGLNLYQAIKKMQPQKKYTKSTINYFKYLFFNNQNSELPEVTINKKKNTLTITEEEIKELENIGKILNKKDLYSLPPLETREVDLNNFIISLAQDKKGSLIVGKPGVGKTIIVEELTYRIKIGDVPNFLKNKIILEVNPIDSLKFNEFMKICEKYDCLIFIDNISCIFNIAMANRQNNDLFLILKHYIDRSNLKIIGTISEEEFEKIFINRHYDSMFEITKIKEPTEDVLYQIIEKTINNYCETNYIVSEIENIKEEIINIIIDITSMNNRIDSNTINNPALSISIVDKAFAIAKSGDNETIRKEHFIKAIQLCNNICDSVKEQAILRLNNLENNITKSPVKILKILKIFNKK